jgi:hypothetical protein
LVELTKGLIDLAPSFIAIENDDQETVHHGLTIGNSDSDSSIELFRTARRRLQQTLVTCMFGVGHGVADGQGWIDCLKRPYRCSQVTKRFEPRTEVMENGTDWFQSEIWRLVGWDILADEQAWEHL